MGYVFVNWVVVMNKKLEFHSVLYLFIIPSLWTIEDTTFQVIFLTGLMKDINS